MGGMNPHDDWPYFVPSALVEPARALGWNVEPYPVIPTHGPNYRTTLMTKSPKPYTGKPRGRKPKIKTDPTPVANKVDLSEPHEPKPAIEGDEKTYAHTAGILGGPEAHAPEPQPIPDAQDPEPKTAKQLVEDQEPVEPEPATPEEQPDAEAEEAKAHAHNLKVAKTALNHLGKNELHGITLEAYEAYDMQDERVRFDTLGRKWTFRPDRHGDDGVLSLILRLGPDARNRYVSNSAMATDHAVEVVKAAVEDLDTWG